MSWDTWYQTLVVYLLVRCAVSCVLEVPVVIDWLLRMWQRLR